jgi:signal transduction histidine kinase
MVETSEKNTVTPSEDLQIAMADVVRFVRQLSHDLRNHLNAAELQSAYLKEIADDPELKGEVQRLRAMISEMGASLQKVSASLATVNLTRMSYEAAMFAEDLRSKAASEFAEDSGAFEWEIDGLTGELDVDPQLLQSAFVELLRNALKHQRGEGNITVGAEVKDGRFVFTAREPKQSFDMATENWGREPFKRLKHGHYGLGLHRARSIVEAHGGELAAHYDPDASLLVTTVTLPLADVP